MKKILFTLVLICSTLAAGAQYRNPVLTELNLSETAQEMKSQIQMLSSSAMEGRKAGSEGEKAAAAYVAEELSRYGVELLTGADMERFGILQPSGDTLRSCNVAGCIQGYDKALRDKFIVIGARLDNLGTAELTIDGEKTIKTYYGANGNASGLCMMLQLARMLSTNSVLLKRSVLFVAFGSSLEGGVGAWYFLNRAFPRVADIDAMINLDMLGTGSNGFYAYTASNQDLNAVLSHMRDGLQPVHPTVVSNEPVNSDHRMFYDKEIPSVLFTTGMYPEYNTERDSESIIEYDGMERELEYLYNFAVELAGGPKPAFRAQDKMEKKLSLDRGIPQYHECDQRPTFLGSSDPATFLRKWVYVYLRYPRAAVENGIQGRVLVDFVIDEKGKVKDVKVAKGVHDLLDDEAVRVIQASPDWKPARINGKKVSCEMSLYVDFKLERRK